jgi:hypothetical protein
MVINYVLIDLYYTQDSVHFLIQLLILNPNLWQVMKHFWNGHEKAITGASAIIPHVSMLNTMRRHSYLMSS